MCEEDDEVTETVAISIQDDQAVRKSRRVSFAETDEIRFVNATCCRIFISFPWLFVARHVKDAV